MSVKVDQLEYFGPPKQIKVHSTDNSFFAPRGIARQLADILFDYLEGNIAVRQFSGSINTGMLKKWEKDAKRWLVEDIRKDLSLFNYLRFKAEKGSKLVMENAFAR